MKITKRNTVLAYVLVALIYVILFVTGAFAMTSHPKPKRIKNQKLMTSYHTEQICLICGLPATPAHIKGRGAYGDDVAENMAPLCGKHHTEQGSKGMTTFTKLHPAFEAWLVGNGWEFNELLNKWKKYEVQNA